jgi:hypothetical protein
VPQLFCIITSSYRNKRLLVPIFHVLKIIGCILLFLFIPYWIIYLQSIDDLNANSLFARNLSVEKSVVIFTNILPKVQNV